MDNITLVRLERSTQERIDKFGRFKEDYDTVVNRIIDMAEQLLLQQEQKEKKRVIVETH